MSVTSVTVPRTSEPLGIEDKLKVDAWRPFCIIQVAERVAVVSGGPSHLSCDALPITAEQIAKTNRSLYAGPSDVVVFVAMRPRRSLDDSRKQARFDYCSVRAMAMYHQSCKFGPESGRECRVTQGA